MKKAILTIIFVFTIIVGVPRIEGSQCSPLRIVSLSLRIVGSPVFAMGVQNFQVQENFLIQDNLPIQVSTSSQGLQPLCEEDSAFVEMIENLDKEMIEKVKVDLRYGKKNTKDVAGIILYRDTKNIDTKKIAVSVNLKLKNVVVWAYNEEEKKYNIPVRAMACSPNKKRTPKGLFYPQNFIKGFHRVYGESSFCQYCTRIYNQFLIHSPVYEEMKNDTLKTETYNGLGIVESGGCVRVTTGDAAWLQKHLTKESPIYIYESDYRGPLEIEKIERIDENQKYDPTDPEVIEELK